MCTAQFIEMTKTILWHILKVSGWCLPHVKGAFHCVADHKKAMLTLTNCKMLKKENLGTL
jgi:hypothetical protein